MNSVMLMARWISPSESLRVVPSSRVRRRASSSLCSCMICVALKRILPRFGAGVLRQPGNAARAAAMASFISSRVESGMRATTSSVLAGFRRSTIFDDFDSTHWPLMKFLQNSVAATAVAMHDSGITIRARYTSTKKLRRCRVDGLAARVAVLGALEVLYRAFEGVAGHVHRESVILTVILRVERVDFAVGAFVIAAIDIVKKAASVDRAAIANHTAQILGAFRPPVNIHTIHGLKVPRAERFELSINHSKMHKSPPDIFKRFIEQANAFIHVGLGDVHRRSHANDVAVEAALADQKAVVARAFKDLVCGFGSGLFGLAVFHQLEGLHHAHAAHIADERIFLLQFFKLGAEITADNVGVLTQIFFFDDLDDGASGDGRHWIATEGGNRRTLKLIGELRGGDGGADRDAVAHALGAGDHVRHDFPLFDAEPFLSGAAEAGLNFVRNKQTAIFLHYAEDDLEIFRRRCDEAANALDGFGDERGDVAARRGLN